LGDSDLCDAPQLIATDVSGDEASRGIESDGDDDDDSDDDCVDVDESTGNIDITIDISTNSTNAGAGAESGSEGISTPSSIGTTQVAIQPMRSMTDEGDDDSVDSGFGGSPLSFDEKNKKLVENITNTTNNGVSTAAAGVVAGAASEEDDDDTGVGVGLGVAGLGVAGLGGGMGPSSHDGNALPTLAKSGGNSGGSFGSASGRRLFSSLSLLHRPLSTSTLTPKLPKSPDANLTA
jgi:hypothetical protein